MFEWVLSGTQRQLLTGVLVGVAGAIGACFIAREQDRLSALYGPRPQPVSVTELISGGLGESQWLDLTGVVPGSEYVIETQDGEIRTVWTPAFPVGSSSESIDVVLRSTGCRSSADIDEKFAHRPTYRGAMGSPTLLVEGSLYRKLLAECYPDHRLSETIHVLDVDHQGPPSSRTALASYAAAGGSAFLAITCLVGFLLTLDLRNGWANSISARRHLAPLRDSK